MLKVANPPRFLDFFMREAKGFNAHCFWFGSSALSCTTHLARFEDFLRREIDFGSAHLFRARKASFAIGSNLAAFLRGVVFVSKPHLRAALNEKSVCLRAMRSSDETVVSVLCFCKSR